MIIMKGTLIRVVHAYRGEFKARATETFSTKHEVFFPLTLEDEELCKGPIVWSKGDWINCNRELLKDFEIIQESGKCPIYL